MDSSLISYIIFCFLLAITPEAEMALVTKNTLSHSKKGGMITILGIFTSLLYYSLITASGLTYILMEHKIIYVSIKYCGAAYLIYLGVNALYRSFKQLHFPLDIKLDETKTSYKKLYMEGLLTNLLNPKIIILYISIIPQFISLESAGFLPIMGFTFINLAIEITWLYCYVLMLNKLKETLLQPRVRKILEAITGFAMITLGCKILFDNEE